MITNLIMDVTNSLSIFEFQGCLFGTIRSLESFENENPMQRNLSSNKEVLYLGWNEHH